jgi:hypothetical protein
MQISEALKKKASKINGKAEKIVMNNKKSKVILNPPLNETVADRVNSIITTQDRIKASLDPQGVLNDPNATSSVKDLAFRILQVQLDN